MIRYFPGYTVDDPIYRPNKANYDAFPREKTSNMKLFSKNDKNVNGSLFFSYVVPQRVFDSLDYLCISFNNLPFSNHFI